MKGGILVPNPIFKEFMDEESAVKAVEKMKLKYSESKIFVINPNIEENNSSVDYGIPKSNVSFKSEQKEYNSILRSSGFSLEQVKMLETELEQGLIIVIVIKD